MLLILEVWATLPLYIQDPDVWWHIAVGTRILRTHVWPTHDIYSFTAHGNPWIADEWMGEVLIALAAHSGATLAGLAWLRVGLVASLMLSLYYYAYLRSRNFTAAFLACAFVYWLSYGFFTLRPQLLGYIYLLITLILLERFRLRLQKSLWLLPILFMFWVNTHGMFPLGLAAISVYYLCGLRNWQYGGLQTKKWTQKERLHLVTILLFSILALLLTPYGSRLATYPIYRSFYEPFTVSHIAEWQPINFTNAWSQLTLVVLLLFFLGCLIVRPKWHLEEMLFLAFAFFGACIHRRMFMLFAIIFPPMLAAMLARWVPDLGLRKNRATLNAALIVLMAICMVKFFPSHKQLAQSIDQMYPAKAVRYLRRHPSPQPMFNEYLWGGYLIWSRGPQHQVFIDGRADLYEPSGVFADYIHMVRLAPQTLFLLRKYSIRSCLLKRKDPLGNLLAVLPNWHRVYEDKLCVIYVRKDGTSSAKSQKPGALDLLRKASILKKAKRQAQVRNPGE